MPDITAASAQINKAVIDLDDVINKVNDRLALLISTAQNMTVGTVTKYFEVIDNIYYGIVLDLFVPELLLDGYIETSEDALYIAANDFYFMSEDEYALAQFEQDDLLNTINAGFDDLSAQMAVETSIVQDGQKAITDNITAALAEIGTGPSVDLQGLLDSMDYYYQSTLDELTFNFNNLMITNDLHFTDLMTSLITYIQGRYDSAFNLMNTTLIEVAGSMEDALTVALDVMGGVLATVTAQLASLTQGEVFEMPVEAIEYFQAGTRFFNHFNSIFEMDEEDIKNALTTFTKSAETFGPTILQGIQ